MSGVQQEQVEGAADFGVSSPSPGGEEMRTAYAVSLELGRKIESIFFLLLLYFQSQCGTFFANHSIQQIL